jgi:hypothetical protein
MNAHRIPGADEVVARHDTLLQLQAWPQGTGDSAATRSEAGDAWPFIEANHRCNALLWEEEDLARRTRVSDAEIAANKRAIDRLNQQRHDATERLDEWLLSALGLVDAQSARTDESVAKPPAGARLNSETAGSMVDRLSILALKLRAMGQQAARSDVDDAHRHTAQRRLAQLQRQRDDLARCLDALLHDAQAGRAYFKVYREFKMYNDPRLNPRLVAEGKSSA